jgi:hypothetical protein
MLLSLALERTLLILMAVKKAIGNLVTGMLNNVPLDNKGKQATSFH